AGATSAGDRPPLCWYSARSVAIPWRYPISQEILDHSHSDGESEAAAMRRWAQLVIGPWILVALLVGCGGTQKGGGSGGEFGPLRMPGGGSAQFRQPGSTANEGYGHEADRSELEQAAREVHDYLVARAGEAWPSVCSYFGKPFRQELAREAAESV